LLLNSLSIKLLKEQLYSDFWQSIAITYNYIWRLWTEDKNIQNLSFKDWNQKKRVTGISWWLKGCRLDLKPLRNILYHSKSTAKAEKRV
jgi:hypothetical protein